MENGCVLLRRMLTRGVRIINPGTQNVFTEVEHHSNPYLKTAVDCMAQIARDVNAWPKILDPFERLNTKDLTLDWQSIRPPFRRCWIETWATILDQPMYIGAAMAEVESTEEGSKHHATLFLLSRNNPDVGPTPIGNLLLELDKDGNRIGDRLSDADFVAIDYPRLAPKYAKHFELLHDSARTAFNAIAITLHVCTARNVALHECTAPRGPRSARNAKVPHENSGNRFYGLILNDPRYRPGAAGNPDGSMPLHVRRGHWAHYGAQYGRGLLFGKLSGRFWVPDIEVGDEHNGSIAKDWIIGERWNGLDTDQPEPPKAA
jgi:hypothetical protein